MGPIYVNMGIGGLSRTSPHARSICIPTTVFPPGAEDLCIPGTYGRMGRGQEGCQRQTCSGYERPAERASLHRKDVLPKILLVKTWVFSPPPPRKLGKSANLFH